MPKAKRRSKTPRHDAADPRLDHLARLEAEIREIRRSLLPPSGELPERPISCLDVRVGDDWYLLDVGPVREVTPLVWPRRLPDSPAWVRGTFRLGRRVVPLVDLPSRLTGTPTELDPRLRIVVLDAPSWLGLIVDEAGDVHTVHPEHLSPTPPGLSQAPFLSGAYTPSAGDTRYLLAIDRLGVRLPDEDGHDG